MQLESWDVWSPECEGCKRAADCCAGVARRRCSNTKRGWTSRRTWTRVAGRGLGPKRARSSSSRSSNGPVMSSMMRWAVMMNRVPCRRGWTVTPDIRVTPSVDTSCRRRAPRPPRSHSPPNYERRPDDTVDPFVHRQYTDDPFFTGAQGRLYSKSVFDTFKILGNLSFVYNYITGCYVL